MRAPQTLSHGFGIRTAGAALSLCIASLASLASAQRSDRAEAAPGSSAGTPPKSAQTVPPPDPSAGATPPKSAQTVPPPGPTSEPTAQGNASGAASGTSKVSKAAEDEALAAIMSNSSPAETPDAGPKLRLYGFSDFTFATTLNPGAWGDLTRYTTFYVGNVNLYMDSQINSILHSLVEVRFMYLPNGYETGTDPATYLSDGKPVARTDTTIPDYTDVNRPIQWGGISIQRAYVEGTLHKLLTLRGGHFLTPYGIWNVDHGSPAIVAVRRPFIVGQNLFPTSQTGLEGYGQFDVDATQFGYHLTLSNGRGPASTYQDLDNNKALGWRLFARNESSLGTITLGFSGYRGTYTNRAPKSEGLSNAEILTAQYRELSLGVDAKWEHRGALVQGEAILRDVAYTDSVRPPMPAFEGGGLVADSRQWGFYALAGYRTRFFGIMPFFSAEYLSNAGLSSACAAFLGGFNIRPDGNFVLKAVATHIIFTESDLLPSKQMLDFQVAWSF